MPRALDPADEEFRRQKCRLAALRQHQAARGPDGKSQVAVRAGHLGGLATAYQDGFDASEWSARMRLYRLEKRRRQGGPP